MGFESFLLVLLSFTYCLRVSSPRVAEIVRLCIDYHDFVLLCHALFSWHACGCCFLIQRRTDIIQGPF